MQQSNGPSPNSRWNTVEMVKAFYGPDDCVNDIADVKFDRPVPIKVRSRPLNPNPVLVADDLTTLDFKLLILTK